MILVNENSPRWLRELARFLPLKSLFFVHGNVLDLASFPIQNQDGRVFWAEDILPRFFERYLRDLGYQLIGFFDPVDGLVFPEPGMEEKFQALAPARAAAVPGQARRPGEPVEAVGRIRTVMANRETPAAFVFNLASRLIDSPGRVAREERGLMTTLLKASLESADVIGPNGTFLKNIIILVCDKQNDLPPYLYVNNPRARSIMVDRPDNLERSRFIGRTFRAFFGGSEGEPSEELRGRFAALTEGLTNYELLSLVQLSRLEKIPVGNIENLCQRYKYGVAESEWDKLGKARLAGAEDLIRSRIKGQDRAVARVLDIVKRARLGLAAGSKGASSRPRGVLFFAGPTGVGKTEMAKSLAEVLFGREDRCLRFDMSEYSTQASDQRLLGAPPGYVGYEEGGQLTNALKEKPFSILLFDEIEKAHPGIFDKFLQILDDGRLTDGKGETIYFSESIIIFTSNLGTVSRQASPGQERTLVDPSMPFEKMQAMILQAIRDHFNFDLGRPEILNRFGDNFVVFDFIKPPVDQLILDMLLARLVEAVKSKWGLRAEFSSEVRGVLAGLCSRELHHGGRGVRNVVDSALVNPLTRYLFDHLDPGGPGADKFQGATLRVVGLDDLGPDAPYRFQLSAELAR
ncbi:MAG: AAA family ATPase [Pseudomonadota bacterium]